MIKLRRRKEKEMERQRELEEKEMRDATFSPKLSDYSKKIMDKKPKVSVTNRLIRHMSISKEKKDNMISELLSEYTEKCTFVPHINPS